MQANKFYQNRKLKWFRIYVNRILESTPDMMKVHASWWKQDEKTGQFIDMDLDQEVLVHTKENEWEEIPDSIERKVYSHWRPM
jgi:hypothetical protein